MYAQLVIALLVSSAGAVQAARTIEVHNGITKDMICYKKRIMFRYHPTLFQVIVNDTPIAEGKTASICLRPDNKITVAYHYSFLNGIRTGAKAVLFNLDSDTAQTNITFSWKDPMHVSIEHGTPVSCSIIPFKTK